MSPLPLRCVACGSAHFRIPPPSVAARKKLREGSKSTIEPVKKEAELHATTIPANVDIERLIQASAATQKATNATQPS